MPYFRQARPCDWTTFILLRNFPSSDCTSDPEQVCKFQPSRKPEKQFLKWPNFANPPDIVCHSKRLRNIKDVYVKHKSELAAIEDDHQRFDRMVELNVAEQVRNLAQTTIVQKAWATSDYQHIHGWVFDLNKGLIKTILEIEPREFSKFDDIYRYDL